MLAARSTSTYWISWEPWQSPHRGVAAGLPSATRAAAVALGGEEALEQARQLVVAHAGHELRVRLPRPGERWSDLSPAGAREERRRLIFSGGLTQSRVRYVRTHGVRGLLEMTHSRHINIVPPRAPSPLGRRSDMPTATTTTMIDVNSATVAELQALKGIGPARAEAIVKGRLSDPIPAEEAEPRRLGLQIGQPIGFSMARPDIDGGM